MYLIYLYRLPKELIKISALAFFFVATLAGCLSTSDNSNSPGNVPLEPDPMTLAEQICTESSYGAPFEGNTLEATIAATVENTPRNFEGPLWFDGAQSLLYCDRPPSAAGEYWIGEFDGANKGVFVSDIPCGGLALNPDNKSVLIAMGRGAETPQIGKLDLNTKELTVHSLGVSAEAPFAGPNDLTVSSEGIAYVSEPANNTVYKILPDGTTTVAATGISKANGVTLSLDETRLYVSGKTTATIPHEAQVWSMPIDENGDLGPASMVEDGITALGNNALADGMAVDCAGNVYSAINQSNAVLVINSQDEVIGRITVSDAENEVLPENEKVSNVAFGGPDNRTLYMVTLTGRIYSVDLAVPGLPY